MNYFNVPADFNTNTLEIYRELNDVYGENSVVYETYGQITIGNMYGSGRANDLLPPVDNDILADYVAASHRLGIGFNYTFNTTCLSNKEFTEEGMYELYDFLKKINDMGVSSITVAMPSLIEFIHNTGLDFKIKASTVCMVNSPNKAKTYEKLGVNSIVLDESINRDFGLIKRIVDGVGIDIELITNVVCHKDCIYELFHHNQKSHDYNTCHSNKSVDYYSHRCIMKRIEEPENILRLAWIRPEDIKYYNNIGVHYFKLQGRQAVLKGDPIRAVKAYMEQRYDGDFMQLLDMFCPTNSFSVEVDNSKLEDFIKPFINNGEFCKKDCENCNYCHNYMKKHFDMDKFEEKYEKARAFYGQYDSFINKTKSVRKMDKEKIFINEFDI